MLFLVHLSDNPGAAVTTLPVASDSNQRTKLMHLNIMLHALSIPSGWAYHYHNQGRRISPAEPQLSALTSQSGTTATVPTTPSHWPSPNANPTRKVAARVPPARGSSATSLIGLQALKLRSNQQSKPGQQCPRVPSSRGRAVRAINQSNNPSRSRHAQSNQALSFFPSCPFSAHPSIVHSAFNSRVCPPSQPVSCKPTRFCPFQTIETY
jgi:hypothetical protein